MTARAVTPGHRGRPFSPPVVPAVVPMVAAGSAAPLPPFPPQSKGVAKDDDGLTDQLERVVEIRGFFSVISYGRSNPLKLRGQRKCSKVFSCARLLATCTTRCSSATCTA
jgi:hypothetical protein